MGKALYRKYRSKSLDDVLGQPHVTTTLQNAIKTGAISHAYLFTGPRGVGKTSVARILAHEINNLPYNEEDTHLDIIEIDAASNRRIDEIRELREKVHIAPTSAKYKVYIIDEVHMLTREAFNALLKTLEEPPDHAVFILATTEAHKVPDTIISRTQRFTFKPIGHDDTIRRLSYIAKKEHLSISDDALELLYEHGKGSFRDSISMLDQIAGFGFKTIDANSIAELLGIPDDTSLDAVLSAIARKEIKALFDATQQLRERGSHVATIAQRLISKCRERIAQHQELLPQKALIYIMKQLLPLTATNSSFETLEVVLLDAMDSVSTPEVTLSTSITTDASPKTTDDIQSEMADVSSLSERTAKPTVHKTYPSDNIVSQPETLNNNNQWQEVLNSMKHSHTTLYGVLRMAKVSVKNKSLLITFQFEFHKKQLTQTKNMQYLIEMVKNHYKEPYEIVIQVEKDPEDSERSSPKNDTALTLSTVSNIFGGAELLES